MRLARSFYAWIACFLVVMLAPDRARAQEASVDDAGTSSAQSCSGTTSPGGEVIALAATGQPTRWIVKDGTPTDVTQNQRPENLNPWGISFSDCQADMRLDFPLTLANFSDAEDAAVEVWAGFVDCSVDANRYAESAGVSHPCWQVTAKTSTQVAGSSPLALTVSVYARDVLRYEQPPTQSGQGQTYDPSYHSSSSGPLACTVQTSDAAVPINLYFLALNSVQQSRGQPGCYVLGTDLVGPPPPPQVTVQSGDTLLSVSWTSPGNDPDVVGFDVWSDPPAGGAKSSSSIAGCGCSIAPGAKARSDDTVDIVDDAEITPSIVDGAAADGADDAESDGASERDGNVDASVDATAGDGGDGGGSSDAATQSDAANLGDAGAKSDGGDAATDGAVCLSDTLTGYSTVVGNGGISQINATYLADSFANTTPPTSSSPLTLTGMKNGENYAVVVTSTDAYANDGPASAPSCAVPQAVSDFWQTYEGDNGSVATCAFGGGAGGAAVIPGLLLATAAALLRRRARRIR